MRLVTYADNRMQKALHLCINTAAHYGVDDIMIGEVSKEFFDINGDIFKHERGAGYWLWKPYIIYKAMLDMTDGDYLIYSDAGVEFVANVNEITSRMDEDIFFFTNGWNHFEWCKRDVLAAFDHDHAGDRFRNEQVKQIQASVIFFRINQKTKDFVKKWLLYCQMPGWIDDSPSKMPNFSTFAEHRHDQAILTSLAYNRYQIDHWWPTQYSYHLPRSERDSYPVIFNHHRKRDNEW